MSKTINFPSQSDDTQVIQILKDKIVINGVECEQMDLEEFIMGMDISREDQESFIRGLFKLIKDELLSDWTAMRIFTEVFGRRKKK